MTEHSESGTPSAPSSEAGDGSSALDAIFVRLRTRGIRRARDNRMVAGVSRGVAEWCDIDPILVRVGFVLLTMFFGFGVTLYLLAWLLLPAHDDTIALERAIRDKDGAAILLCIVTAISIISPPSTGQSGWIHTVASALALGAVVWFVRQVGRGGTRPSLGAPPAGTATAAPPTGSVSGAAESASTGAAPRYGSPTRGGAYLAFDPVSGSWINSPAPSPSTPPGATVPPTVSAAAAEQVGAAPGARPARCLRRRPAGPLVHLITVGLCVVAVAAGYLVAATIRPEAPAASVAAACGLTAVSLLLIVIGLAGRRALLPALLAVLLMGPAVATPGALPSGGVGDRAWAPATVADLQSDYSNGLGDTHLDLRGLNAQDLAGRTIQVHLGAGDLQLDLPTGVTTQIQAHVGAGSLRRPDAAGGTIESDPRGDTTVTVGSGTPTLNVVAHLGLGDFTITQPGSTP